MTTVSELLTRHRDELTAWIEQGATGLLRFETVDDLVQGACTRALTATATFVYRSEGEAVAWLRSVARRYIADRHDHWSALRRGAGRVVRFTWTGATGAGRDELPPADPGTGPATFAQRREMLTLATRALATLPPRDQKLLSWQSEGVPLREQAGRLELSYDAAQRAAHRAVARFRQAFKLIAK